MGNEDLNLDIFHSSTEQARDILFRGAASSTTNHVAAKGYLWCKLNNLVCGMDSFKERYPSGH